MSRKTSWIVGALVLVSVFALLATPAQATLIVGFQFAAGGTSVTVPASGGTYTVNVVATTDNASVTGLGISQVYYGALSAVLNGNLGVGDLDGDITSHAITSGLAVPVASKPGSVQDSNSDGRDDLGPVANSASSQISPTGATPWWEVPGSGGAPVFTSNSTSAILGTFTVTIPPYTPNANAGDFLRYSPNAQPSNTLSNLFVWTELTSSSSTARSGKYNAATGNTNTNNGAAVTFSAVAVPEPATLVLLGLAGVGLISFCRPKRRS